MKNYVSIKDIKFPALFAITPEEHEEGLMWKPWPPPIMCFIFKDLDIRKFWMKNTISPLDIVFCRNNIIISIHHGEPLSEEHIGPDEDIDLVVELPFGHCKKFNFSKGDKVELHHSLQSLAFTLK